VEAGVVLSLQIVACLAYTIHERSVWFWN